MKRDSNRLQQFMAQKDACSAAVEWVGKKSLTTAWKECERVDWMMWLVFRLADDDMEIAIRRACADIAESKWSLCVSDAQVASAWAYYANPYRTADARENKNKLNCDIVRKYIKAKDIQQLLEGKP